MKKLLLLSILFSFKANAQDQPFVHNYGNGIYYVEADLYGQLPEVGARLAQFKQSHPKCLITSMSSLNGRLGTIGYIINCELR